MDRNRYLYALSQAAVIVDSDTSGGTWAGALENLKHKWTPALVRQGAKTGPGNPKLAELGLMPVDAEHVRTSSLSELIAQAREHFEARGPDLPFEDTAPKSAKPQNNEDADELFEMFLARLRKLLTQRPRSEAEIAAHFKLDARQVKRWLEAAQGQHGITRSGDELMWRDGSRAA